LEIRNVRRDLATLWKLTQLLEYLLIFPRSNMAINSPSDDLESHVRWQAPASGMHGNESHFEEEVARNRSMVDIDWRWGKQEGLWHLLFF
jgi:hypothetical protein